MPYYPLCWQGVSARRWFVLTLCSTIVKGIGTGGIEPPTPSASRKCSPTELRACNSSGYPTSPASNFPAQCQGKTRFSGFAHDLHGDTPTHAATELNRDGVGAELLDRLFKQNFSPIDSYALGV